MMELTQDLDLLEAREAVEAAQWVVEQQERQRRQGG